MSPPMFTLLQIMTGYVVFNYRVYMKAYNVSQGSVILITDMTVAGVFVVPNNI